jgi:hypothetical protein
MISRPLLPSFTPQEGPDVRRQIPLLHGLPRDPLLAQLVQALEQQKQEEAAKGQMLQYLGFGPNPLPMNALPHGAGVLSMGGQVYTRPQGMDQETLALLQSLLGLSQGGVKGPWIPGSMLRNPMERPGSVPESLIPEPEAESRSQQTGAGIDPERLRQAVALHRMANTPEMLNRLYSIYPEEMAYLLAGGKV